MWIHNKEVVNSNPTRVAMKMALAKKATGNHLIKFTSLEKFRVLSLVSAKSKSIMPCRNCDCILMQEYVF